MGLQYGHFTSYEGGKCAIVLFLFDLVCGNFDIAA